MARIPIYEERQAVNQNMPVSEMRAPDMNAGAIGKALGQVGAAFKDVANVMSSIEDEKAKTWAAETASQARVEWQARMQRLQETADPGAPGFTQKVAAEFDAWSEETMKSAPNRVSQSYLGQSLLSLNDSVKTSAIQFEAIEGRANRVRQLKQSYQNDAVFLANSNDPEAVARLRGDSDAVLDSAKITPAQREELRQNRDALWGRTGVEKLIDENPQALLDQRAAAKKAGLRTSGNAFLDLLPPDQWDSYTRAAETKIKQDRAIARAELQNDLRDRKVMALNGLTDKEPIPRSRFEQSFNTPKEATEAYNDYRRDQQMASDIASMRTLPKDELAALLNEREPAPGKGYADEFQRYESRRRAALEEIRRRDSDPAAAVAQGSSSVDKAQKAMQEAVTSDASTPELIKATTQKAVTASLAEQRRLGISKPRILTNAEVEAFGSRIAAGKESSADIVVDLEQRYGSYFPQVMDELMAKKKLPPAMMIIPNVPSPSTREMVSRLSVASRADLEKVTDKTKLKDIKDQATKEIAKLIATGGPQTPESKEQMAAYMDMMERIAMDGIQRGVYSSGTDAAIAASKMLIGHFKFEGRLRMPGNLDPELIQDGLKNAKEKLFIPSIQAADVPPDMTRNRKPEDAVEEWRATVKARSFWLSDKDTANAQLWAVGGDGSFYRVKVNGKQIEMPFSEAARSGESNRFDYGTKQTTEESIGGA